MTNARKQRLLREALGPGEIDVPLPEKTIRAVVLVGLAVLVGVALSPTSKPQRLATSLIDARAASTVTDAPPAAIAIDSNAAEGNVPDMTY
jgi:hypothetical protein